MNPGLSDEVGQTARTLVEALKSAPAILALVIFNMAFLVVVGVSSWKNSERWERDSTRWKDLVEITMKLCHPEKQQ